MAAYLKFNIFPVDLLNGVHNFGTHLIKVTLVNSPAPVATNTILANLTQTATTNFSGAAVIQSVTTISVNQTGAAGTGRVVPSSDNTWTATGTTAAFQYVILWNDTPTGPVDPLIAWYDYGSSITLANTETFTTDFDNTNAGGIFGLV